MQFSMIAFFVVCCSLVSITQSVIQYKMRGPPGPPRLSHAYPPHYTKSKWPMPPRPPARPHMRPIPVHMASYKVPVLARPPKIPQVQPAPLIFPSAVWKTPTAVYRPPVEKPFLTSPPVTQQYEFHLNKEPIANIPTIKQIGEKGPIHTIPAPNLGPADKPNVLHEDLAQKHTYHYTKEPEISPNAISPAAHSHLYASNSLFGAQALPLVQQHQYQVTENAEPADQLVQRQNPFTAQKTYYAPDPDPNNLLQKLTQYADTNSLNNLKLFSSDVYAPPQQMPAVAAPLTAQATNLPLSAQELYQLLNGIPQQHLMDSYGMSIMQQPLQQHYIQQPQPVSTQNYQLLNTPQLAQSEQAYYNQIPDSVSQQIKDNFKPQFHTFNYEEQSSRNSPRKEFVQSRVTADYNIEPEVAETYPKTTVQNPHEALAQTQYIQQYFATREDNNVAENELAAEQEGSTKASQILNQLSAKNDISPSMFYSSLPNREAAETLATLQAAGSINSNILKLKQHKQEDNSNSNHRESMRIFVPDEEENYDDMETQASGENIDTSKLENAHSQGIRIYETTHMQQQNANSRKDDSVEYGDYSSEENNSSSSEEDKPQDSTFGNKIKSKNTR